MEHRLQMTNVLSELTENQNRRRQYSRPICEDRYVNKRTNVLRELTQNHHLKQTCEGCGIGKIGTAALYSFCGQVFVCDNECFQLYIDSIPYGIPE